VRTSGGARTSNTKPGDTNEIMTKRYKDPDVLKRLHYEDEMTYSEMADELDCAKITVQRYMNKHDLGRGKGTGWIPNHHNRGTGDVHFDMRNWRYPRIRHSYNGEQVSFKVHRLVAVAEYGYDEVKDKIVHHRNNVSWDNRPDNLKVMTKAEHAKLHDNLDTQ
jgi:hypothetical protein